MGYLLMAKVITPRIGAVLNTRRQLISDNLKRAKDADAEAKQMKEAYESALQTARTTAAEAASKAMAEAKLQAEAAEADLTAKLAKKTRAAETKLSKMRDEAMANIHDVAKELTLDTVSSVTGMKVKKRMLTKQKKLLNCQVRRHKCISMRLCGSLLDCVICCPRWKKGSSSCRNSRYKVSKNKIRT